LPARIIFCYLTIINRFSTYCLCIFLLFAGLNSLAQNTDYLKTYKDTKQNDTTRILALYDLIWDKVYTNLDTAEILAKLGLEGELTAKNPKYKWKFDNAYGAIFQLKGDYIQAVNYYQQGLKLSEQLNDLRGQTVMLGNIGTIYIKLKEYKLALNTLKKCLSVMKKLKDEYSQASIYNNFCIIYLATKDYDLSMQYAMQSKTLYEKYDDKNGLVYCYNNIANIYEEKNMKDEALDNYKIALKYAQESENVAEIARTYSEIGHLLYLKGEYGPALDYLKKSEKLSIENEDLDTQSEIYQYLYEYHKKKNQNAEALSALEKYHELKDSLQKDTKQREISQIEFEYEYQKKAAQDSVKMEGERSVNTEKLKAKNAEIAKANIMLVSIIVVVALLIVVSIVIYNRFRLTQRQKHIIEEKNRQTEEQKLIIEEKQKEILDSINYAKRIQDSLLDDFASINRFFSDTFVMYTPKDIVSGDFYWLSKHITNEAKLKDGRSVVTEMYYIAVCDSTGHGVPGGFMSLLNMAYLSEAINEKDIVEPNKIFDYVRERLINTISKNDQKDGFDGVLMRFDRKMEFENKQLLKTTSSVTYAAAYNSPIMIRNNELIELDCDKMPVGYGERPQQFTNHTIELEKGDVIYMYTDGYADQFGGPRGKKYKYKQLNDLLLTINNAGMADQLKALTRSFNDWKGNIEQVDDVCMVGIRI
jgi:serine phosphatase RsbU (regulator of sigma subunit)